MKTAKRLALIALCGLASALAFAQGTNSPAAAEKAKNWTPPPYRIYAQTLSDQIMAQHPELLSEGLRVDPERRQIGRAHV